MPSLEKMPSIPVGYPLSYFADTEPFASWLGHVTKPQKGIKAKPDKKQKPEKPPSRCVPTIPPEWTNHVRLERFTSRRISRISKKEAYTGIFDHAQRPYSGSYEYIVEFTTTREIAIELPEPKGTAALFGNQVVKKGPPDRLRLRFIVEPKDGRLVRLDISGTISFRLPRTLVSPVVEHNHRWIDAPTTHVILPLGNSILSLNRGLRPVLTPPLRAPSLAVRLGQTDMVAQLGGAQVDISGTAAKPRIRFNKIRLAYLT
jgi:hypothetical protein